MSSDTNDHSLDESPEEILDEDGKVDTALKREIIKARTKVDETDTAVFRDATINPQVNLNRMQKVYMYGETVKMYLRRIEPILRIKNIPSNKKYYTDIEIGSFTLYPPDVEDYRLSLVEHTHLSETQLRQRIGIPRGADLPEPYEVTMQGLRDVIESEPIMRHQWAVCVDNHGPPSEYEYIYPEVERPVPKTIYEDAVRQADLFLQEAGIGLDTDISGSEMIVDFDMSGEEPQADYAIGKRQSNPDL